MFCQKYNKGSRSSLDLKVALTSSTTVTQASYRQRTSGATRENGIDFSKPPSRLPWEKGDGMRRAWEGDGGEWRGSYVQGSVQRQLRRRNHKHRHLELFGVRKL